MKSRRVTILIPTRNRADTLHCTLKSCVSQNYDQLDILVSDNHSEDRTAEVVAAAADPRIRRVKTERRLGMSQNWEFALSHVDDGYVLTLGDDDALLPNAIRDIVRILEETDCEAIAWREAKYYWPGSVGGLRPNTLRLPLRSGWRVESATEWLTKVVGFQEPYTRLPSLYWGVLSRDAIRRATGGSLQFFHSLNPDLYSALSVTMAIDRFVWSERPYRLNGLSKHSTGVSFGAVETNKHSPREQFLNEGNHPFHPDYVLVPSSPVYVAEAYQQAREHVPGGMRNPEIPLELLTEHMMRDAAVSSEVVYGQVVEGVREMMRRGGQAADAVIAAHPFLNVKSTDSDLGLSLGHMTMKLDGDDFAVSDVHGAATLAYTIVRLFEGGYLSPRGIAQRALGALRRRVARLTQR